MEVTRTAGNVTKGPADRFTGDVWMWPRIGATAPGEWHWHGAAPGTFMVHLAVTDGTAEWAGPVTDNDYQS
jgi:hypothetical protein